jgi:hypothetical protein
LTNGFYSSKNSTSALCRISLEEAPLVRESIRVPQPVKVLGQSTQNESLGLLKAFPVIVPK